MLGLRLCVLPLFKGKSHCGDQDPPECWAPTFPHPRPAAKAFGTKPHHSLRLMFLGNELQGSIQCCVCFLSSWTVWQSPLYETVSCEATLLSHIEERPLWSLGYLPWTQGTERRMCSRSMAMQMLKRVVFIYNNAWGSPQGNVILFVINPSVRLLLQHNQALH